MYIKLSSLCKAPAKNIVTFCREVKVGNRESKKRLDWNERKFSSPLRGGKDIAMCFFMCVKRRKFLKLT